MDLQRSAARLTKLAQPRIKPGPAVDVQKELVNKLDVEHAAEFGGGGKVKKRGSPGWWSRTP